METIFQLDQNSNALDMDLIEIIEGQNRFLKLSIRIQIKEEPAYRMELAVKIDEKIPISFLDQRCESIEETHNFSLILRCSFDSWISNFDDRINFTFECSKSFDPKNLIHFEFEAKSLNSPMIKSKKTIRIRKKSSIDLKMSV
ncbi:hypothetical protein SSS_09826 [Sarcoptes scabiei]|nr:hypothetical protein SSS_09826 [Sarcoptes scabiei]